MKTEAEIRDLKAQWLADPIWDIEKTEGFEAHETELRRFSDDAHARWEKERQERLEEKATSLGCPGNIQLAAYVIHLERRLHDIEKRLFD